MVHSLGEPKVTSRKKKRTQRERKRNAGRKAKIGVVRQPRQLSLDAMNAKNNDLFETLLQQYEPFLTAWAELGNSSHRDALHSHLKRLLTIVYGCMPSRDCNFSSSTFVSQKEYMKNS